MGGGGEEDVRNCWKFLEQFKDNFLVKFKKVLRACYKKNFRKRVYFGRSLKMVPELENVFYR